MIITKRFCSFYFICKSWVKDIVLSVKYSHRDIVVFIFPQFIWPDFISQIDPINSKLSFFLIKYLWIFRPIFVPIKVYCNPSVWIWNKDIVLHRGVWVGPTCIVTNFIPNFERVHRSTADIGRTNFNVILSLALWIFHASIIIIV